MAVILHGNDTNGAVATADGDLHIIQNDATLANTGHGFNIATFANVTVNVAGSIVAGFDGIASTSTTGAHITVEASGSVAGDSDAISLNGTGHRVVNFGTLSGFGDSGIEIYGDGATASNHGGIDALYGIFIGGDNARASNTGTITASTAGMFVFGDRNEVNNSGQIISADVGVDFGGSTLGETALFLNTGDVIADDEAVHGSATDDTVVNAGTLVGDVVLLGGNDVFDNRGGHVSGRVQGGQGDDTYVLDDAATDIFEAMGEGSDEVQSTVHYALGANIETLTLLGVGDLRGRGNSIANEINGNVGDNALRGRAGNDTISGEGGDDTLFGQGGNDRLDGDNGDDKLVGGKGADTQRGHDDDDLLQGQAGGDKLYGSDGDDKLQGGGGNDTLNGGRGDDVQDGGSGADIFVFSNGFGIDTIKDFNEHSNSEKIDLSGVGAISGFTDLKNNHMTQDGSDIVIDDLAGNTITVQNALLTNMNAGDFIF